MPLIYLLYSDSIGRIGVFICAMSEVERVKFEGQVDDFQTVKAMRSQRPHMVDTPVSHLYTIYMHGARHTSSNSLHGETFHHC